MLDLAGAQYTGSTFAIWPTAEDGYYGYFGTHGWFYYIATAQFEKFDAEGNLAPWDELSDTYILRLPLEDGS